MKGWLWVCEALAFTFTSVWCDIAYNSTAVPDTECLTIRVIAAVAQVAQHWSSDWRVVVWAPSPSVYGLKHKFLLMTRKNHYKMRFIYHLLCRLCPRELYVCCVADLVSVRWDRHRWSPGMPGRQRVWFKTWSSSESPQWLTLGWWDLQQTAHTHTRVSAEISPLTQRKQTSKRGHVGPFLWEFIVSSLYGRDRRCYCVW